MSNVLIFGIHDLQEERKNLTVSLLSCDWKMMLWHIVSSSHQKFSCENPSLSLSHSIYIYITLACMSTQNNHVSDGTLFVNLQQWVIQKKCFKTNPLNGKCCGIGYSTTSQNTITKFTAQEWELWEIIRYFFSCDQSQPSWNKYCSGLDYGIKTTFQV